MSEAIKKRAEKTKRKKEAFQKPIKELDTLKMYSLRLNEKDITRLAIIEGNISKSIRDLVSKHLKGKE